jgi:branched-chain amino acid transport system ATP-binding protein
MGVRYVPQERDVFPKLTVTENLEMGGYTEKPNTVRQSVEDVLNVFPALARLRGRRAGSLSGGERKMLAVGRALMTHPSLILLDEPTANLSPALAKEFLHEHIAKLTGRGTAVLIIEQRAMEALSVSARGYLLVGGKVALAADSQSLLAREDIGELFLGHPPA